MIAESLDYLCDGDNAVVTVLIGGALLLASPLVVPSILVLGYVSRVLRQTASGDDAPPVFDAWGDLLVEGAKGFAVTLVYSLVPLAVFAVATVFGVGAAVVGSGGGSGSLFGGLIGGAIAVLLALAALAVSLVGLYVTPAALATVADSGRVGDGFAVGMLWTVVTKRAYAVGWLTAAAVVLGGVLAVGVLSVVPVLGTIAGLFVQFYALIAAAAVIGWTWADVRPVVADSTDTEPAERPAV
ncbi:DUF4013 domain-containing protein [Halorubrum sp. BV1]|uniref:DUF4013 domain-containing protein n=1 Tax=Halorubrum sp. BV1 TaxID=1498500 RepID=UPI0006789F9D|nr:DUF4013 domain-containing protein [Halorubrum sp. BV1]